MKIVLTGGAGFIGSHVADLLIQEGHCLAIIDNFSTGKIENIPSEATSYNLDICNKGLITVLQKELPDAIIHHAAQISVRNSVENPLNDVDVNIRGTINLLQGAIQCRVKKFIFASTGGALYGEQDYFPANEEHPLRPLSPYGVSKLAVEKYLYFYYKMYGLNYIALRYSNVYGPRQDPYGEAGVVAIFTLAMLDNGNPVINGTGEQTRDFIYVSDVAKANLLALHIDFIGEINISTGKETSVNELFTHLKRLSLSDASEKHGPSIPGEQFRSVLSWEKAFKIMNWSPQVNIEEGLGQTIQYFKKTISNL